MSEKRPLSKSGSMRWSGWAYSMAWWISAVALPVVAVQGKRLRKTVPRLPEACGPNAGVAAGLDEPMSLTVIGESTVAGVGVKTHGEGIACKLAEQIRAVSGHAVARHAVGMNGATIGKARETLVSRVAGSQDIVVVMVGVNDTVRLTSTRRWRKQIGLLIDAINSRGTRRTLFTAIPPLHLFPALP